jgi:hypothetical protein
VFTARYALSPYIKQIRFVFKGLIFIILYARRQKWIVLSNPIVHKIQVSSKVLAQSEDEVCVLTGCVCRGMRYLKCITLRHTCDWRRMSTLTFSHVYSGSTVTWQTRLYLTNYQENLQFQTATGIWSWITLRHKASTSLPSSHTGIAGSNVNKHTNILICWKFGTTVNWSYQ